MKITFIVCFFVLLLPLVSAQQIWPELTPYQWETMTITTITLRLRNNDIRETNTSGDTALHMAARYSTNPEIISFLVQNDADVYQPNKQGLTPLYIAAAYNQTPEIIRILLEQTVYGSRISNETANESSFLAPPANNSTTGSGIANESSFLAPPANNSTTGSGTANESPFLAPPANNSTAGSGTANESPFLAPPVKKGTEYIHHDPNFLSTLLREPKQYRSLPRTPAHSSGNKITPTQYRYTLPSVTITNALRNDRIQHYQEFATAPLIIVAVENTNPIILSALLQSGADIGTRTRGGIQVIHRAAALNSNPVIIALLVDAGAEVNTAENNGKTPLHYAAAYNVNPEVLITLLNAGADPTVRDNAGNNAWDYIQINPNLVGTDAYWMLHSILY